MNGKKLLAMLLCIAMCVSMFPTWAFAVEDVLPEETEETQVETVDEAATEAPAEEPAQEEPEYIQEEAAEEPKMPVADENTDEPEAVAQEPAEPVTPSVEEKEPETSEEAAAEAYSSAEETAEQEMDSSEDAAVETKPEMTIRTERKTASFTSPEGKSNGELLDTYAEQQISELLPDQAILMVSKDLGARLKGNDALVYSRLKEQIADVAAGRLTSTVFTVTLEDLGIQSRSWTAEELGVEAILVENSDGSYGIAEDACDAVDALLDFDLDSVMRALLADCPYELYWYDKTAGVSSSGYQTGASSSGEGEIIFVEGDYVFSFSVAGDYAAGLMQLTRSTVPLSPLRSQPRPALWRAMPITVT